LMKMKKFFIVVIFGLLMLLMGSAVQGIELEAGASFNTVAMEHMNELINTYNARMGMNMPNLRSGLGLFANLMIGLPVFDLGLGVEHLSTDTGAIDPHGRLERIDTSALGFLGMGSWTILGGGLQLRARAALGWYSADYSNELEAITAQGSAIGYKVGLSLDLGLTRNLSLQGIFSFRGLAFKELIDQRGNLLTVRGEPFLDFSGLEIGAGVRLNLLDLDNCDQIC